MRCSVITVTFKDPVGLRVTLGSLLAQLDTIRSRLGEVIVVDSSPELSSAVLKEFSAELPILHVSMPPQGIYAAMNKAVSMASFSYIWFLNGGDALENGSALVKCCERLERTGADFVCANARLFRSGSYKYTQFPERCLWDGIKNGGGICHQAVIYRRDSFSSMWPFRTQYRLAADFDLHARAYLSGKSMTSCQEDLVRYDTGGASASYQLVLAEYNAIIHDLWSRWSLWARWRIKAGVFVESLRVRLIKRLSAGSFGLRLRRAWWGLMRWKQK